MLLLLLISWLNIFFTNSKEVSRGTINESCHFSIGSVFNVLIGVFATILFGMIILLLSKLLITVYLTFTSSIVPFNFNHHRNSTKSPNFIFLFVNIKTQDIRFPMVVSIANHMLREIHHIIIATSNQIISKVASILKIINNIKIIPPTNFEFFFA